MILRKSHAHSDGDARARGKRELEEALDSLTDADEPPDSSAQVESRGEDADADESDSGVDKPRAGRRGQRRRVAEEAE